MVYPIAKRIIFPIYRLWVGKVQGIDNLLKDGSFIIAANHASYYDGILPYAIITPIINKQIHALVNSRYWNILPARIIIEWGKGIPVYVGKDYDAKKNKLALKKAECFLKKEEIIQIFPEGTRSPNGNLKKGHIGIAKLALKAKVPIVPFGIIDSYKVLPKGKLFPRFKRCKVKIGRPLYFKGYYNKTIHKKTLEKVTRKIMKEIGKLIGQEYKY